MATINATSMQGNIVLFANQAGNVPAFYRHEDFTVIAQWCEKNAYSDYSITFMTVRFTDASDATLCYMAFG